ncbi:hypothetical protein BH23GEM4_BH23GEM4_01760 [soil metagenome]
MSGEAGFRQYLGVAGHASLITALNRKCSWGTAAAIVFGVYLLFLIGGATLATLFRR